MNSENDALVSRRGVLRAGAAAAAAGAATGTAAAQEGGDGEGQDGEGGEGGGGGQEGEGGDGGGGGETQEVTVGPNDENVFDPETLEVRPGTTVRFVWDGTVAHNVHATDVPEEADWDVQTDVVSAPNEYEYTFDGPNGEYNYVCDPHASVGMEGTIVVTDNPSQGEEGYQTLVPDSAKTMAVAAVGSMTSVLGIAYFFMKYGGDYGEFDE